LERVQESVLEAQARAPARVSAPAREGRALAQPAARVRQGREQAQPGAAAQGAPRERAVVQAPEARAQEEPGLQARAAQVAVAPVQRAVACPARAWPVRQPPWATCHSQTLDRPRAASRRAWATALQQLQQLQPPAKDFRARDFLGLLGSRLSTANAN
jgi:hypothetical protein